MATPLITILLDGPYDQEIKRRPPCPTPHLIRAPGEPGASPRVSGLASGSWVVYLEPAFKTIAILVQIVGGIIAIRKAVGDLRKKSDALKEDKGLPTEITEQLDKIAEDRVDSGLRQIAIDVVSKSATADEGRRNELTTAITINIRFLAKKLDEGVRIEVEPPKAIPQSMRENLSPQQIEQLQKTLDMIKAEAPAIAKMEDTLTPVLLLSDPSKPITLTNPQPTQ